MTLSQFLADQLNGTREWTLKLLADFKGGDWTFQPGPGLAHALWTCGHLANSQHALVFVRCLKRAFLPEEFITHFPMGGPIKSAAEHAYPSVAEVRRVMDDVHAKTLAAVRELSFDALATPAYGADGKVHPHYSTVQGAIGHVDRHEAFHAGQIVMIRRLLGRTFLR